MPHLSLAEGICAVIVVSILSVGVLAPQLRARSLSAAVSAASVLFLGLGAVGLGLHLVTDQGLLAAVVVVAAALAVGLVTRLGAGSASDRLLGGTAVAFTYGLIVLVGWLESSGREQLDAHYALGFATFFLDGLVIGLIRERFGEVVRVDRQWYGAEKPDPEDEANGTATTIQVASFGIAATIALILLHIAAADLLNADRDTGASHLSTSTLGGAFAVAVVLLLVAYVIARRSPQPYEPPMLAVSPSAALVAIGALTVWCVAAFSQIDDPQIPAFAAAGAGALAVMTLEDLLRSPARLQLQAPGLWGRLIAVAGAAAMFFSVFLILSTALWDGSRPVGSGDAAIAAIALLMATAIIVTLAAGPLAAALRIPKLTPEPPWQNVALIQVLYAGLAIVGLVLPAFVVGRVELHQPENVGLATVSALAPVPALLGALIWVLHTNSEHLRGQRPNTVPADIAEEIGDEEQALRVNRCRLAWLAAHVNFQNRAATALVRRGWGMDGSQDRPLDQSPRPTALAAGAHAARRRPPVTRGGSRDPTARRPYNFLRLSR